MMKNLIPIIKENKTDVFCVFIANILIFISFTSFNFETILPTLISILLFFTSMILSLFFLTKKEENKKILSKIKSAYSFFYYFVNEIGKNTPIKSAYDSSSRYLISYQEVVPYDEIDADSLNIYKYKNHFSLIIEKNKSNEAYLLNYRKLSLDIDNSLQIIEENEKKNSTKRKILISIFLLSIILIKTITLIYKENLESSISNYLISFLLYSFFPLFYQMEKSIYKELTHV